MMSDPETVRALSKLTNSNAVERKRGLAAIQETVERCDDLVLIWQDLCSPVVKSLQDSSERCREIAAQILISCLDKLGTLSGFRLSSVFPVLSHRLSNSSDRPGALREPSEEVRLQLVTLLHRILTKSPPNCPEMTLYLDDIIPLLKVTLLDPFADVKRVSCQSVVTAANTFKKDFHLNASNLLSPLTKCLSHQQNKVRVAAVSAIGSVLVSSRQPDDLKKVVSHLAQRLFDPVPSVRMEVSAMAGNLLVNWDMAYSNCAYLLPLLLTGLDDELPDNAAKSREIWIGVGKHWIEDEASRDDQMKDKLDFDGEQPQPEHYPRNGNKSTRSFFH